MIKNQIISKLKFIKPVILNILFLVSFILLLTCTRNKNITSSENLPPEPSWPKQEWLLIGLESEEIKSIGIHPTKPNIILAGTYFNFSAQKPAKLFRSEDYGVTWDTLAVDETYGYQDFIFNPDNPDIVYAVGGVRLLQSNNIGKSWVDITGSIRTNWETFTSCMAFNPMNSNEVYAGTCGFFGGELYKSFNMGKTWECITKNITNTSITDIVVDPRIPDILYFSMDMDGDVWKSENSGRSWKQTALRGTGVMTHDLLIDLSKPNILYAALSRTEYYGDKIDFGIMKTMDGGKTWKHFNNGLPDHFQAFHIVKNYRNGDLFTVTSFGNNGEIYKMKNTSGRWEKFGINSVSTNFYYCPLSFSPNFRYLYFGCKGVYVIQL